MKKRENDLAEEFLRDYARVIIEAQAAEFSKFMDEADADEKVETGDKAESHVIRTSLKSKNKKRRTLRYAAVFIAVVIIAGVAIPVDEVSAWMIWKFDALFGNNDDHTEIKPNDESDFVQYYVDEIPEGFEVASEQIKDGREHIVYIDEDDRQIVFSQIKREFYSTNLDSESREAQSEIIGDFEVFVNKSDADYTFEFVTDEVVIVIYTNAGYDVGKEIIENLKKN